MAWAVGVVQLPVSDAVELADADLVDFLCARHAKAVVVVHEVRGLGLLHLHVRKLGRLFPECLRTDLDAGCGDTNVKVATLRHEVIGRCGAKVKYKRRCAIFFIGCNDVDNAVGANSLRILPCNLDAGLDPGANVHRLCVRITPKRTQQGMHDVWYDARHDGALQLHGIHTVISKHFREEYAVLIGSARCLCCHPEGRF